MEEQSKAFTTREESVPSFKVSKDRLTLLVGPKVTSDFQLKPKPIYNSENPMALKNYAESTCAL